MKVALGVAAVFAVAVTGGLIFNKNSPPTNNKTSSETIVTNNSIGGNIVDDLKKQDEVKDKGVSITNLSVNPKRVVYFNSDFNYYSVRDAVKQLKELEAKSSDPIWLLIDSPGGSVIDGGTLLSQMEASKAPVYTVCTRLCASMAAMTHAHGAKRYALDRAILMYHPASGGAQGQIPNMLSLLKTITRYVDKMNHTVVSRSKLSKAEFDSLVAYELWIDSEDALAKGLVDGIVKLDVNNSDLALPTEAELPEHPDHEEEESEEEFLPARRVDIQMISPYAKELWNFNGQN